MREANRNLIMGSHNENNNAMSVAEAFQHYGMDYNVAKEHLIRIPDAIFAKINNGESLTAEDIAVLTDTRLIKSSMATVRTDTDTTLGVVGSKYGICQNAKALEFIDFMTNGTDTKVQTCGVLDDGSRIWMSVKMPKVASLGRLSNGEEDSIEEYLLFTNSHDGSGAVTCCFTPIRVICRNTLAAALRLSNAKMGKLVFKHTSGINERMDFTAEENKKKAIECLKLYERCSEEYVNNLLGLKAMSLGTSASEVDKKVLEFATRLNVTDEKMVAEILKMGSADNVDIATRTKNNISALMDSIYGGVGQSEHQGSGLWLANGITTYYQNDYKPNQTDEERFVGITEGTANKAIEKAFDLIPRLVA